MKDGPRKAGAKKADAKRPDAKRAGAKRSGGKPAGGFAGKSAGKFGGKSARPKPPRAKSAITLPREDPLPPPVDLGNVVRVSRIFDAPAAAILRAIVDTDRRGWAPTPLYRVISVLAPRFVRLALPDGSEVAIGITRQGNTRCGVQVEHIKIPKTRTSEQVRAEWMGCLAGLAEQLDFELD